MSSTAAAAGAAFLAALAWRDALIFWAALHWGEGRPASREALVSGYCSAMTRTPLAWVAWAGAAVVTVSASWLDPRWPTSLTIALLACVGLASAIEWRRARPIARLVAEHLADGASGAHLPGLFRRLLLDRLAITFLMAVAVGLAVREASGGTQSHAIAAAGAGFLAATLWNEVIVDRATGRHLYSDRDPWSRTSGEDKDEDEARATMLSYYAVMTVVATKPNLAAVFGAMATTFFVLVGQLARHATSSAIASIVLFVVFAMVASTRTWKAASLLGRNELDPTEHAETVRMLGRTHLLFVVLLLGIIVLQVLAPA